MSRSKNAADSCPAWGSSLDAVTAASSGQEIGGPPFSGWYSRSLRKPSIEFSAPWPHLKISSMNAMSASVARRANTWVYSPLIMAATSIGPKICLGSV